MQFKQFLQEVKKNRKIFSLVDIRQIFGQKTVTSVQLNRWQKQGYITKIKRGLYALSDSLKEIPLFLIANLSHEPSYVSLESALYEYGFIPDIPHSITSISSKKTYSFAFSNNNFFYRKIKTNLFIGYKPVNYGEYSILIAEPEKALLDFFYFNIQKFGDEKQIEELRFNYEEMSHKISKKKLRDYGFLFESESLNNIVASLITKI
ncbi:MAG: hypothetical protein ACD_18C00305G0002 [uncultured bacterium]|nr:MAG: hypothetical protein ACD_18C00305G0002 [uncultured bacterium]OGH88919.1 MAG: hypothetical protein A2507_00290 [Candidatus Magasanikbacteria bacterium RIFOXYD12_FULL_33_17]HAO52210.1 hypothetical protein [Candidatus Magasanikbacteria bacterium]